MVPAFAGKLYKFPVEYVGCDAHIAPPKNLDESARANTRVRPYAISTKIKNDRL